MNGAAPAETPAIESYFQCGRFAGDYEAFVFAVDVAAAVAQHQPDVVSAVRHVRRGQKARLPHVFFVEVAQRLGQAEWEQRHNRNNRRVSVYAQHRISGADDAWPQQGAWDSKE